MLQLRDYQIDIANKAFEILKRTGIVYLVCEVRVGKSVMSLETCMLYGAKKVLFLTKLKAIKGIEKDYKDFGYENSFEIQIINNESLHKITDNDFDLVISDEHHRCLIGETLVNNTKIKNIKIGDFQNSYNFALNKYEKRKVLKVHKNKLNENLIKIKCNGKEIICTENHEIFTQRGWIRAKDIKLTDSLQVV